MWRDITHRIGKSLRQLEQQAPRNKDQVRGPGAQRCRTGWLGWEHGAGSILQGMGDAAEHHRCAGQLGAGRCVCAAPSAHADSHA